MANVRHVVLFSGGLDSAALLAHVCGEHPDQAVFPLFVDYGQRNGGNEWEAAQKVFKRLSLRFGNLSSELKRMTVQGLPTEGSALMSTRETLPHGADKRAAKELPRHYLPGRNLVLLSLATAYAESLVISGVCVWIGVIGGGVESMLGFKVVKNDKKEGRTVRPIFALPFPDAEPPFLNAFEATAQAQSRDFITIESPFLTKSKIELVEILAQYGIPVEDTWSCFSGGAAECGKCAACYYRRRAIQMEAKRPK